ncbi:leucine-rich repeat-containing protein 15-like [Zophobas morio]|uniref:leucine-rich repeat-containing protein 15-like n=1 Tax=Zophobas morio TaxID=2755281 RepID=UPI003083AC75
MASAASSRCLFALILVLTSKNTHPKCIISRNASYCDTLQDLYTESTHTLQKRVAISGTNLDEFKTVPVESASKIEDLSVTKAVNKIPDDAFRNFHNLKTLSLVANPIERIGARVFRDLRVKVLGVTQCGVKNIEEGAFSTLTQLEKLRLSGNNLTEIKKNVFNNLTVDTLVVSKNQVATIEKFAFAGLPNLGRLYLDNNYLTEFNVQDYVSDVGKLERLWLHGNNLTQITNYMLEGLLGLKVLNLGFNFISVIEPRSFGGTPNLNTLVLSNNVLKTVDGGVLPMGGLTQLGVLYLDHNRLMYLSSNFLFRLNGLKSMSLGGNPWRCPCLDLLLRWLNDNEVKLSCDKNYFSGNRPVCVDPSASKGCVYSYDDKLLKLFQDSSNQYPPAPFCLL